MDIKKWKLIWYTVSPSLQMCINMIICDMYHWKSLLPKAYHSISLLKKENKSSQICRTNRRTSWMKCWTNDGQKSNSVGRTQDTKLSLLDKHETGKNNSLCSIKWKRCLVHNEVSHQEQQNRNKVESSSTCFWPRGQHRSS